MPRQHTHTTLPMSHLLNACVDNTCNGEFVRIVRVCWGGWVLIFGGLADSVTRDPCQELTKQQQICQNNLQIYNKYM